VQTAADIRTIIATSCTDAEKQKPYIDKNCEIIEAPVSEFDGRIDLNALMSKLGEMGIDSIMLEGGETLNFSALKAGIVNRVQAYIAPKIFGGSSAKTPVGGEGFKTIADAVKLKDAEIIRFLGDDILYEAELKKYGV
jgi:diaminohydroxyphosphoribosylaminopyrimidine deaminase/5-amino-6-(5-phosphoribosylamino)uracil reductase